MTNVKIGVVGIPGKWSTETLCDAVEARTGFRHVIDMADVSLDLATGALWHGDTDLSTFDGLIIKKISQEYCPHTLDRLEMLRTAEARGVQIFSNPTAILRLIDRLSCTVSLRNAGIPMPDTIVTENRAAALEAVRRFGSAVFKPLFSTKARGMCVLEASSPEADLQREIASFSEENPVMYIQQKADLSGQDLGMVFLGGRYLGTYARVSQTDTWNTTIESGGKYAPFEPDKELIALAEKAQRPFGLDFTTVDVALTPDGPIVFEVSAFGGFKGALEGAGLEAATLYADYVLEKVTS
ncbi:SSU ribosomal protein S6P modification protein [Roseibium hamelinense]|uniref:SSU ribosomal protein S6P modification protein n=1 Tax=Roseibium hamelinense TaxID=150831 RepID=A0A562TGZ7_9HYPH|nr:GAK system ATP-grasp enzyme [Roseibium hamelinense]MTI45940.1 GAK system ATP-grasp enzyme [Roseibium hamelinense]TWI92875.1 SSU ribosomal protein S6P modification protein [Roseibium hamelinense]